VGLSAWELAACLGVVLVGGLVQGSIGFGVNLIAAPVIALVAPGAVPGSMVLLSLPLTITMAAREHHAIDRRGVTWIFLGRLPGTVLGVAIVAAVPDSVLAAVVGGVILLAVGLSVIHPHLPVNRGTAFGAGSVSGVTGTAAAVDGPPLALLYQHHHGPALRSTLATCFVIGTVMTTVALTAAGEITGEQLVLTLELLPALLVGWAASTLVAPRVDARQLRTLVLAFAALAGAAALVRGLAAL
jgi:uncharacterized membrane protein YfcA